MNDSTDSAGRSLVLLPPYKQVDFSFKTISLSHHTLYIPCTAEGSPSTSANGCAVVSDFKLKLGRKVFYCVFVFNSQKFMRVDECVSLLFVIIESQSDIKANITN